MWLFLLVLVGCGADPNAPPPRPEGLLQVLDVEVDGGVTPAAEVVRARREGCGWGREVWWFDEGKLTVQNDFVCAAGSADEAYACSVRVSADAVWAPERGVYTVAQEVRGLARFVAVDEPVKPKPGKPPPPVSRVERTRCAMTLAAGEYTMARVRNGQWKWEMRTPAGAVLRMDLGDERADLTAAMRALGAP